MEVNKISIDFSQDGNTLGTTEEYEELNVSVEYQLGSSDGPGFLTIKSKTGWSFDEVEEFTDLLNKVRKAEQIFN